MTGLPLEILERIARGELSLRDAEAALGLDRHLELGEVRREMQAHGLEPYRINIGDYAARPPEAVAALGGPPPASWCYLPGSWVRELSGPGFGELTLLLEVARAGASWEWRVTEADGDPWWEPHDVPDFRIVERGTASTGLDAMRAAAIAGCARRRERAVVVREPHRPARPTFRGSHVPAGRPFHMLAAGSTVDEVAAETGIDVEDIRRVLVQAAREVARTAPSTVDLEGSGFE
jgi:uncharacterized protein (DUF433 family)